MKKIINTIAFILMLVLSAKLPSMAEFRDISSTDAFGEVPVVNAGYSPNAMVVKNSIKDSNKKLYSGIGKSQIINFDNAIKRVSISDPELADIIVMSPKQLMVNGKKSGSTSLVFWSHNSPEPTFYNLIVQQDADEFLDAMSYVAPNENVSIIFNDKGAVLSGNVSSSDVKEKIMSLAKAYNLNLTDVSESPSKQVLLEVKVTEISKKFTRDIGINGTFTDSLLGSILPTTSFNKINTSGGLNYFLSSLGGKVNVDIKAAETKGDIKILAEPRLLVANNEEGHFNVGNEVPVPSEISREGQVAYNFKKTGVLLSFKPTIMEKTGRIRLKLAPEVSEIDRSAGVAVGDQTVVPGFKTRRVETTVELMDGETLVIAGITTSTTSTNRTQVPILGNIPLLGVLFKDTEDAKNDAELVIFITPKIIDNSTQIDNI